jgi:hypothetical protein
MVPNYLPENSLQSNHPSASSPFGGEGKYSEHGYRDDEVEVFWSEKFACKGRDE